MRTQTELSWWAVLVVAPPIVAFLIGEALIDAFAQLPIRAAPVIYKLEGWAEAAGRMQLLGLMLLYYLFAIGVFGKFVADLLTLFDGSVRGKLIVAYCACIFVGAAIVVLSFGESLPRIKDLLDPQLFKDAVEQAGSFGHDRYWGHAAFVAIVLGNNAFTAVAVPAFIAGGVSCLVRFGNTTEQETWVYQSERLKTYIYMSAGFLVIGVLYLKAWAQYPGYLLDKESLPAYTSLVNSYAMYTGVQYSIILSAFALPVAMILSRRADELAARIVMREQKLKISPPKHSAKLKTVREREKLFITPQDVFKTLVALLAPFITGTVASLSSVLG